MGLRLNMWPKYYHKITPELSVRRPKLIEQKLNPGEFSILPKLVIFKKLQLSQF